MTNQQDSFENAVGTFYTNHGTTFYNRGPPQNQNCISHPVYLAIPIRTLPPPTPQPVPQPIYAVNSINSDSRQCGPSDFVYSESQRTLVCGECDFSFTRALIHKRGGGANLCSTSLYDHQSEWLGRIQTKIGSRAFMVYLDNLQLESI